MRNVHQIRFHGRGGQGVVTAAELLSVAAFLDGKHAQAFPSFGSERTGAPVIAFCRISDHPIRTREPITHPDVVIIQDSTLLHQMDVFAGLSELGYVLINSTKTIEQLSLEEKCASLPPNHSCTVPASEIASKHLGRPFANVGLVAGFAEITGIVCRSSIEKAILQKFSGQTGILNGLVAAEVFRHVSSLGAKV